MFFVFEVTETDKVTPAVGKFDTQTEAVQSFHQRLSTQMKNSACLSELVMVIADDGAVYRSEKYTKPVEPEVEPETATEE